MPERERTPQLDPPRRGHEGHRRRCAWTSSSASATAASFPGCAAWARCSSAVAGPDALALWTPVHARGEEMTTVAEFTISEGQHVPFVLAWHPSHMPRRHTRPTRCTPSVRRDRWWNDWSSMAMCDDDPWADAVRAERYHLEGAHLRADRGDRRRADDVAARSARGRAQLGLPLLLAARRHLDAQRCCWRPATTTRRLAWRDWLLRAVAGGPTDLQILYGVAGERELFERELDWLVGLRELQAGARRATPPPTSSSSTCSGR